MIFIWVTCRELKQLLASHLAYLHIISDASVVENQWFPSGNRHRAQKWWLEVKIAARVGFSTLLSPLSLPYPRSWRGGWSWHPCWMTSTSTSVIETLFPIGAKTYFLLYGRAGCEEDWNGTKRMDDFTDDLPLMLTVGALGLCLHWFVSNRQHAVRWCIDHNNLCHCAEQSAAKGSWGAFCDSRTSAVVTPFRGTKLTGFGLSLDVWSSSGEKIFTSVWLTQ